MHGPQQQPESIEILVEPHGGIRGRCSHCQERSPGYDRLPPRRWLFVPLWNIPTYFCYAPRRVCPSGSSGNSMSPTEASRSSEASPRVQGAVQGALVIGRTEQFAAAEERIPVYLEAKQDLVRIALTFALGDQWSQLRFLSTADTPPSLLQDGHIHRRHLNESQRALAAAKAMPLVQDIDTGAEEAEANLPQGRRPQKRVRAASLFNVSPRLVQHAIKIQNSEYLIQLVQQGSVAVSRAAALAGRSEEEQRRILQPHLKNSRTPRASDQAVPGNVHRFIKDLTPDVDIKSLIPNRPGLAEDAQVALLFPSCQIG